MSTNSLGFVRTELLAPRPAPASERSAFGWIRGNLFATPKDTALTILAIALLVWTVPDMLNWLFFDAVWSGSDRTACLTRAQGGVQPDGWSGACWAFVSERFEQFMFGRYPIDERWRPTLVAVLFAAVLAPMLMPRLPYKGWNALVLFVIFPIVAFFLLHGGVFGLQRVETPLWGGLMVTLILSFVGIAVSLPIGILLALGRRSHLPVIRVICVTFIEVIRGVPLITVLFMANVMLPLFLPTGWTIDNFLRALVGVALFASAYMAEVVRGGLQAIPKGQYEGADSLGLTYWQKTRLIIMPQALKLVIPGIVNTFIGLFKDTSLVSIIGMFDLLGIVQLNFTDTRWITPITPSTGLIFAGFIFWLFCFGMSRYSAFMERHLDTGHKR
ncbi:amino-acid transporter subunit; membrane component of ABC superfamily [Pseudorhizobium banfieldiae]|uniref:Amino-acid transporter subunit membrane component of ABC superfamily n=1 Tax=Pseudorhizobium banfieldiae TaxID=1125847 RepID=L0NFD5_9HYPH|nr:amino acid ABC transporter permease [Pseudorhizobium banfieldiae]CAD6611718.1 amino acid ABC transporter permease [arsenite-oxidising bacterium NT-25]CCF19780.1 amino-acid transporter subunit; membrane component of ABC superfamily [Pseudorhizobium banfieldiae]